MRTIYELRATADVEGRRTEVVGYFENREDAERVCRTSVYGHGMNPAIAITPIAVYENPEEFVLNTRDNISLHTAAQILGDQAVRVMRERVINGFTDEQRRIMGL